MKITIYFLFLMLINSLLSTNSSIKVIIDNQKLPNSICKVANDITSSKNDTEDILIGNVGHKSWSSTINDIAKCIGSENAVVINDFKQMLNVTTLRKASVVILTFDGFKRVNIER